MLHDPRHDKRPTLAGFALFVASKDPNERYEWLNCTQCAVGQYLASLGVRPIWEGEMGIANMIAQGRGRPDWTFGKLAERILDFQISQERAVA